MTPEIRFSLLITTNDGAEMAEPLVGAISSALVNIPHEVIVLPASPDRRGRSAAIIQGLRRARGAYVGIWDEEGARAPALLPRIVEGLDRGHALVVCSRSGVGVWGRVASFLSRISLGLVVKAPCGALFAFRRELGMRVEALLDPRGDQFLLELLARNPEADIEDIPSPVAPTGRLGLWAALRILATLWRMRTYSVPLGWLRRSFHLRRYKIVAAELKSGSLLDIGAGRPSETMPDMAFLRFLNRPDAVGLDIRPLEGPFRSVVGSILRIPFPDHSFDNVVALEVIEHVEDVAGALAEIRRVLKPDGVLILSTPDCNRFYLTCWWFWTHCVAKMWEHAHVSSFPLGHWRALLEKDFRHVTWKRYWYCLDLIFRVTNTRLDSPS